MRAANISREELKDFYFLTAIDPNRAVKGSRDPLGFQTLWTHYGRQVVSNLTTVTTSIPSFTTLLLGLHYAAQLIDGEDCAQDDLIPIFLRFEQIAAYSRYARGRDNGIDLEIRGIDRVSRRMDDRQKARISTDREHMILSDQKTYGIWGLYTVAAKTSGLIEANGFRLTPAAEKFVSEHILVPKKGFTSNINRAILSFLVANGKEFRPFDSDSSVAAALANAHEPKYSNSELGFFTTHLLHGGTDKRGEIQERFWQLLFSLNTSLRTRISWGNDFSMPELKQLIDMAGAKNDEQLAERLVHVQRLEELLVPLEAIFNFMMTQDGQTTGSISRQVSKEWKTGLKHINDKALKKQFSVLAGDFTLTTKERLSNLALSLRNGEFENVLRELLVQNKEVMERRGSAPWIEIKNEVLNVKFRERGSDLPAKSDVAETWKNNYFLGSLKSIGGKLIAGAR